MEKYVIGDLFSRSLTSGKESTLTTAKPGGDIAMGLADEIRKFAYENYIKSARERGEEQITIRAGDIHKEMGLKNSRATAICGALGANQFQDMYGVKLIDREGPTSGFNVYFTFELD